MIYLSYTTTESIVFSSQRVFLVIILDPITLLIYRYHQARILNFEKMYKTEHGMLNKLEFYELLVYIHDDDFEEIDYPTFNV